MTTAEEFWEVESLIAVGDEEFHSLEITTEDDWENNPAGENNSAGEWTDEEMTLWGVYTLLEDLLIWRNKNSDRDELLLLVTVNSVGD